MLKERAAQATAAKKARLLSIQPGLQASLSEDTAVEEQRLDINTSEREDGSIQGGSREWDETVAMLGDDDDSDFDNDKAQQYFDDWMVSLSIPERKMLGVLLYQSFRTRQKMSVKDAATEAGSIVGFNEKTVRMHRKDFYENKGKFKESTRGKYDRKKTSN